MSTKRSGGLTVKKMKAEIVFDADKSLDEYRRGEPLKLGELRAFPEGTIFHPVREKSVA